MGLLHYILGVEEICAGLDPRRTASVLAARGFIDHDGGRYSKLVRVSGHGRLRPYHVVSKFVEGEEDA
jgi:hypothetical protein